MPSLSFCYFFLDLSVLLTYSIVCQFILMLCLLFSFVNVIQFLFTVFIFILYCKFFCGLASTEYCQFNLFRPPISQVYFFLRHLLHCKTVVAHNTSLIYTCFRFEHVRLFIGKEANAKTKCWVRSQRRSEENFATCDGVQTLIRYLWILEILQRALECVDLLQSITVYNN